MGLVVAKDRPVEVRNHLAMRVVGNFGHFEHSPGQLVTESFLFLGFAELFQCHGPAVVGRPDPMAGGETGHGHGLPLRSTKKGGSTTNVFEANPPFETRSTPAIHPSITGLAGMGGLVAGVSAVPGSLFGQDFEGLGSDPDF